MSQNKTFHVCFLDGLRGIAILMVLAIHSWDHTAVEFARPFFAITPVWLSLGGLGVQLFFILSAFTLLLSGQRRKDDAHPISGFYLRRALRILPLWWLAVPLYGSLYNRFALGYLAQNLLFYSGFFRFLNVEVVGPQWSLFVEVLFYIGFPLLLPLSRSVARAGLFLAAALAVQSLWVHFAPQWGVPTENFFIEYFPLNQGFCFAIGYLWFALVQDQKMFDRFKRRVTRPYVLDLLTLLALVVLLPTSPVAASFGFLLLGITASLPETWFGKICRTKILVWFGRCCYSIYLGHIAVIYMLAPMHGYLLQSLGMASLPMEVQFAVVFVSLAITSLAVGFVFYFCIECPFIDLGKKFAAKKVALSLGA